MFTEVNERGRKWVGKAVRVAACPGVAARVLWGKVAEGAQLLRFEVRVNKC